MVCKVDEFITEYRKRYGDQIPIPEAIPSFVDWVNNFTDKVYALGRGDAMQHLEKLPKSFFTQWGEKDFFGDTKMIEWFSDIAYDEYCKGWEAGVGK